MAQNAFVVLPREVIYFRGPYIRPCVEYMYLLNNTSQPIAFKLKTTSPFRFSVKPIVGIVPVASNVTITLTLYPLIGPDGAEIEGSPFDRSNQKFMVEWAFLEKIKGKESEQANPAGIIQKAREDGTLMDTRLRCMFDADSPNVPSPAGTRYRAKKVPVQKPIPARVLPPAKQAVQEKSHPSLCLENPAVEEDGDWLRGLINNPLVVMLTFLFILAILLLPHFVVA